ncbi:MAG: hypothetical protein K6A35_10795 [bacterium]|nr:hypothetical protein [bacterium]
MACFLVPAAEAAVVSVITKATHNDDSDNAQMICKVPLARKLHWLTYLLLGGTILLTFEHMWHGEIVPWFPFLTAASDPTASSAMLKEMSTVGVAMAGLITTVWVAMCLAADAIVKRTAAPEA